jgi:hypothetical protein
MKVPLCANCLMTDSVYIASNITFDNLAPLSTYLGKPGDPARGGLPFAEYRAARTSTARPRSRRCWTRPLSSTGRRTSTAIRISSATAAGRSARWWTPTIPMIRCCGPVGKPADGLDQGVGRAYRRTGAPLRPRAQADVLPARIPERMWDEYLPRPG